MSPPNRRRETGTVTEMETNFAHLTKLGVWRMASVIWNICDDFCAVCPRNIRRNCNDNCRAGIADWLRAPYIPGSFVWKEKKK